MTTEKIVLEGDTTVTEGRISAENVHICGIPIMKVISNIFPSGGAGVEPRRCGKWRITIERIPWQPVDK